MFCCLGQKNVYVFWSQLDQSLDKFDVTEHPRLPLTPLELKEPAVSAAGVLCPLSLFGLSVGQQLPTPSLLHTL